MKKQKTFTKMPNNLLEELMYSDINASQRRVVDLIIRLTYGCHNEWALIRYTDFCACRVSGSHIKRVINPLVESGVVIRNGSNKNKYKVSQKTKYRTNKSDNNKFSKLLSRNLKHKSYQVGNTEVTDDGDDILPTEEGLTSQNGNKNYLPSREVLGSKNKGFELFKETTKILKNSDKESDSKKISSLSEIRPENEIEYVALEGCKRLEPDNPRAYSTTYLFSLKRGLPIPTFHQYVSEIEQGKTVNKGAVFNKKVSDYFKKRMT